MPSFIQRLQHGWSAFRGRDRPVVQDYGSGSYRNPMRPYMRRGNERSIITAIYNRIAMDVASHKIEHVRLDVNNEFYIETIRDSLNSCLTLEANIDQTSRAFFQDVVFSLFDEGNIAIVPTATTDIDPTINSTFTISSLRVAKIVKWYPRHVTVELYDEVTGLTRQKSYPKSSVAIVENPFYSVMNESNSVLQRLLRKLALMDIVDEETSSGKLNLIIQLPYVVKSAARKQEAEKRRKEVEMQLTENKYGIAYTDGTEKITQLSRPLESNLMGQIEYLMNTLYSQLGITPEILNGTASEEVMLNYNTRTVEPILSAIVDEMNRKFLTKTARTQGQAIRFSSDPFKLVPMSKLAELAEKFTGNGILTPNEFRQIIGFKPSDEQTADTLGNQRINPQESLVPSGEDSMVDATSDETNQNGSESPESFQEEADSGGSDNIADIPISVLNEMMKNKRHS